MKTVCSVIALCLVLSCFSLSEAGHLERVLLQTTPSPSQRTTSSISVVAGCVVVNGNCTAQVSANSQVQDWFLVLVNYPHGFPFQAISDAASSIADTLAEAINEVEDDGDVDAAANSFAIATAQALARIITSLYGLVFVNGESGDACVFARGTGTASASAIAEATTQAFSSSTNSVAQSVADCFSRAISIATATVTQTFNRFTCVDETAGFDSFLEIIESTAFVQATAAAFGNVLTSIVDGTPSGFALCSAISSSFIQVTNGSG